MKANKKKGKTTFKSSISHPNTGGPPNIFPKHIEIEWEKCCSKRKTRKAKCNLEMHNPIMMTMRSQNVKLIPL